MCLMNLELINFITKHSMYFGCFGFVNFKFDFTWSKLNYLQDYFAMVVFVNSNFEKISLLYYFGLKKHLLVHWSDFKLSMLQPMYFIEFILRNCFINFEY